LAVLLFLSACGGGGGADSPPIIIANSATLSWDAPTTYEDGSALSDLAGYRIYYAQSRGAYVQLADTGSLNTSYTVDVRGLTPGIYYIAVTAYSSSGAESAYSNALKVQVQ
jgi:hypothetical protein